MKPDALPRSPTGSGINCPPQVRLGQLLATAWWMLMRSRDSLLGAGLIASLLVRAIPEFARGSSAELEGVELGLAHAVGAAALMFIGSTMSVLAVLRIRLEGATPGQAAQLVVVRLPSLVATQLLRGGAIALAAVFGLVPVLIPGVLFYCAPMVAVLDNQPALAALARSRRLVRGHHGLVALVFCLEALPGFLSLLAGTALEGGLPLAVLVAWDTLLLVATSTLTAALYESLRQAEHQEASRSVRAPIQPRKALLWSIGAVVSAVAVSRGLANSRTSEQAIELLSRDKTVLSRLGELKDCSRVVLAAPDEELDWYDCSGSEKDGRVGILVKNGSGGAASTVILRGILEPEREAPVHFGVQSAASGH